ncbi:MAG: aldehyde ferredoxin oxidoreductase family protein [Firmicutes bacterium]|nr:aldehyde ferredoxin oxidoreductase family protein [Bacillota bacterium]
MSFPDANILEVDLGKGSTTRRNLPGQTYRLYPGGSALGLYLLLHDLKPGVEPLSEENILVFSVSPFTGLPISGQSRMVVTTKSPLTGTIGDSQAGGYFPANLKANNWDAIVVKGKSSEPVYIMIDGESVEIKPAGHLWGKVTGVADSMIKQENNDDSLEIAQIGPAGENMVRFACIINMNNRANGRNGTGAVMGSKNLKAIVVKKARRSDVFDKKGLSSLAASSRERLKINETVHGLGLYGTASEVIGFQEAGFLATDNWNHSLMKNGAENLDGTTMSETILVKRDNCYACSVRCKRVVEIPGKVDPLYGGPEYETCASLGAYCGINNLETVSIANQLCNMYGIDTISCGGTIAFAMECYEKGLLTRDQTGDIDLRFGNNEALVQTIELIAKREGIGALLAEGSKVAAETIGHEAVKLSISVKGQELPAHMPQMKPALGLIYAVNPFGADHQSSEHDPSLVMPEESEERIRLAQLGVHKGYDNPYVIDDEKVRFAYLSQCFVSVIDSLCLCQFVWGSTWQLYGPSDLVELCREGIGWETSLYELMLAGERRLNMMRFFNAREGFTAEDDYLPDRIFEPLPDGPNKGQIIDRQRFDEALKTYYEYAGWHVNSGKPKDSTLAKLSLSWLLDLS